MLISLLNIINFKKERKRKKKECGGTEREKEKPKKYKEKEKKGTPFFNNVVFCIRFFSLQKWRPLHLPLLLLKDLVCV